jgi:type IV secretory pathway VirB6-like protein
MSNVHKHSFARWRITASLMCVVAVVFMLSFMATPASAATSPGAICTHLPSFQDGAINPAGTQGLLGIIVTQVQTILNNIASTMYNGIINDSTFSKAVKALATLYIAIYGILFTVGMMQSSVTDFTIRGVKLGIVAMLLQPGSWSYFSGYVVTFFNQGTDDLINIFTSIAVGGVSVAGDPPFKALDDVLTKALSTKMVVTVMAIFTTGIYGLLLGFLLVACLGSFIKSIFQAMLIYLMALVLKTVLFGIAPIFISFILFARTKPLFDGWLNQIISASLQPVLLFAFFGFFAKLIEGLINKTLAAPVCWTELAEGIRGSPYAQRFWTFMAPDASGSPAPFGGLNDLFGAASGAPGGTPPFPIENVAVLLITFIFIAELSTRFNQIVIQVAQDLANASANLSALAGSMNQWFENAIGGGSGSPGAPARPAPGTPGGPPGPPRPTGIPGVPGATPGGTAPPSSSDARNFITSMSNMIGRRGGGPGR